MAIRIPYGIDPDEVWEVDYCAEVARTRARIERDVAASMRDAAAAERTPEGRASMEAAAARAEARAGQAETDLAGYVPGSGTVFRVGAIPCRRRAELLGRQQEVAALAEGKEKALALAEWSRDVVAVAVKGHRNLKTSRGADVPFELTDGRVSDRTLEAYGHVLVDLAWIVLTQQHLGPDGKNA